jgi:hypothetical protein
MMETIIKIEQQVTSWVRSKGGWAHLAVSIYLTVVLLYNSVPAFHELISKLWSTVSPDIQGVVMAVVGVVAFYASKASDR